MRKRTTGYGASESRFRLHTRPAKVYRGWPTYAECKRIQKLADKAIARSKRRMAIASNHKTKTYSASELSVGSSGYSCK